MKTIFRLHFFVGFCHHGDRIGNSFSDSIAVKPFVGLFAYHDSRRPLELPASLPLKKGVGLSCQLDPLPQRGRVSSIPDLYQVWKEVPGSPQSIPQKEMHETTSPEKRKTAKDLPFAPGKGLCVSLLLLQTCPAWSLAHHIHKAHPGAELWRAQP